MKIDRSNLNSDFHQPPLLVGGKAIEFYGLRLPSEDFDLLVSKPDFKRLDG